MKVASVVFLFLVSVFLFKEEYSIKQILGIALTIAGIYLVTSK